MSFAGNGGISPVQGFVESSIGLEAKLLQQDDSNSADDVAGDRGVALNIIILMGGLKVKEWDLAKQNITLSEPRHRCCDATHPGGLYHHTCKRRSAPGREE